MVGRRSTPRRRATSCLHVAQPAIQRDRQLGFSAPSRPTRSSRSATSWRPSSSVSSPSGSSRRSAARGASRRGDPRRNRRHQGLYPGGQADAGDPAFIAQGQSQYGMQTFDQCLLKLYRDGCHLVRDRAGSGDQRRRLRPQGPGHLLRRASSRSSRGQPSARLVSPTAAPSSRDRNGSARSAPSSRRADRAARGRRPPLATAPGPPAIWPHACAGAGRPHHRRGSPRRSPPPAATSMTRPSPVTGSPPARRAATARRACAPSCGRGAWPGRWSTPHSPSRPPRASSSGARRRARRLPALQRADAPGPRRGCAIISCAAATPRRWWRGSSARRRPRVR